LLKSGEYNPQKIKKQLINNKIIIIEDVRDRIVCEAIRLILYHIYIDKNYNGLDHAFGKNRS
jgi:retron-type reverse transcriptase